MNAPPSPSSRISTARALRLALRALLALWAAPWLLFALAHLPEEGLSALPYVLGFALVLLGLVIAAWRWPFAGGLALAAAGAAAAAYFPHWAARAGLAAPAVVLGLAFALSARPRRLAASAPIALALLASLVACLGPRQDPADLPYGTGSIRRHANGRIERARLVDPAEIEGLPSRSWVWWHADGRLDSVELARDFRYQGHEFPEGTRLFLDAQGRLRHVWLSRDTSLDGFPCRGGAKIAVAFHPGGRVAEFFLRGDRVIQGVPCRASLFHSVRVDESGRVVGCELSADYRSGERAYRAGDVLETTDA